MQPIRIDNHMINKKCRELKDILSKKSVFNGALTITLDPKLGPPKRKPTIHITEKAKKKMVALVTLADKEVGWHGIVTRNGIHFTIEDIMLFPQEVTGASVRPIEEEYGPWVYSFSDDIFNNMRFHGHSHVNMGVSPSGTDLQHQIDTCETFKDFYIFLIINKKGDSHWVLYDIENNLMYPKEDLVISYEPDEFEDSIKAEYTKYVKVSKPTYTQQQYPFRGSEYPKQGKTYEEIRRELNPELYKGEKETKQDERISPKYGWYDGKDNFHPYKTY